MFRRNLITSLLCAGIVLTSCEQQKMTSNIVNKKEWNNKFSLDVIQKISYEIETITVRTMSNGNIDEIDKINNEPIFAKEAITIGLDKHGQIEMFAEKKEPSQSPPPHEIPKSSIADTKFIHLLNSTASFYDTEGQFVHSIETDPLIVDPQKFIYSTKNAQGFNDYKNELLSKGAVVENLGNGTFKFKISKRALDGYGSASRTNSSTLENTYVISIIDTTTFAPIISGIFNQENEIIFKTYYKYEKNDDGELVLFAEQSHTYEKNKDEDQIVEIQTNSIYSNVIID